MEKKMINNVYESTLITVGAVTVSMLSKKILKEPLGTPDSLKGTLKLAVAVASSSYLINYLQDKKILPVDPFSK